MRNTLSRAAGFQPGAGAPPAQFTLAQTGWRRNFSFVSSSSSPLLLSRVTIARSLSLGVSYKPLLTILIPGFLIFLLGVYDDIYSVGPYVKFTVQGIAGAMVYAGGLRILNLPVLFQGSSFLKFHWFSSHYLMDPCHH